LGTEFGSGTPPRLANPETSAERPGRREPLLAGARDDSLPARRVGLLRGWSACCPMPRFYMNRPVWCVTIIG
jgi:hypothetical protein